MTKGDTYNLDCPYCFQTNHYIGSQTVERFYRQCTFCGRNFVIYQQLKITLKANTVEEDPLEPRSNGFNYG